MQITWITSNRIEHLPDGSLTSKLASARYRVLIPLSHFRKQCQYTILQISTDKIREDALRCLEADAVIFSKSIVTINENLLHHAKKKGALTIFDICDNHFASGGLIAKHYQHMANNADHVVCNSKTMAAVILQQAGRKAIVIEDPYARPRQAPRFAPDQDRLRLLWFGSPSNLDSLNACLPGMVAFAQQTGTRLYLTVITDITPIMLDMQQAFNREHGPAILVECIPWALNRQWQALSTTDAVILPSLQTDHKLTKSANRMIESFNAGRMVLANPIPSYEPFLPWAWIGDDLTKGIAWMLENQASIPSRIQLAQDYISSNFAPSIIAAKWEQLLQEAWDEH
jgi:hypothetical protein